MINLPLDMRVALDVVAMQVRDQDGKIRARVIGQPILIEEFGRYASRDESDDLLIALGANREQVRTAAENHIPIIVTVVNGALARWTKPVRADSVDLADNLSVTKWRSLGYRDIDVRGIQGIGSLSWAFGERVFRRVGRSDLADRCRIGMLRTLTTTVHLSKIATVRIHVYVYQGSG